MAGSLVRRMLRPVQLAARRFVMLAPPEEGSFIGNNGCINAASSFVTWNQVEGDYLEFGVYRGASFAAAYHALHHHRARHASFGHNSQEYTHWKQARPRFFAFDSFEGLPEGPASRQVDYAPGSYACSEAEFRANLEGFGVNLNDVVIVKGYYDQTLTRQLKEQHNLRHAAMVMIDCDLYESTRPVMDFLTDIVGQGTILIFHDWFRFKGSPQCGEQRACREWLERNPHLELIEYWREGPQAVSFLVNLR